MENSLAFELIIPAHIAQSLHEPEEYIKHALDYRKKDLAIKLFQEIERVPYPVVVQKHLETWTNDFTGEVCFRMHCRLWATKSVDVVIPSFVYVNHRGQVEWKCNYCAVINKIEATFCGELHKNAVGCGHPRQTTRE